jgi:hypothetical protein
MPALAQFLASAVATARRFLVCLQMMDALVRRSEWAP